MRGGSSVTGKLRELRIPGEIWRSRLCIGDVAKKQHMSTV